MERGRGDREGGKQTHRGRVSESDRREKKGCDKMGRKS